MTRNIMLLGLTLATAARFAADGAGAAAPEVAASVAEMEFTQFEGKRSYDCALIPADTRLDLLKGSVRAYIANRLNGVNTRHEKDAAVIAWKAYDAASAADPLQTAVAKPEGERPAAPDYEEAYARAIDALTKGEVRKVGDTPKPRATKDPLIKTITDIVVREVFAGRKAADPKYTFFAAKKEVGADGLAYLNTMIEAKAAQGVDRAGLEKMRDDKYVNPAKAMLGLSVSKGVAALPSIL